MSRQYAHFAWAVLAFTLSVVLWGAYVRATGAGAGCGNHWPLCNGEVLPRSPGAKTLIEFTHRLTSGLDGILIALLFIGAWRAFPRRHPVRIGAALSLTFLGTEALLGAALVKLEEVAQNASVGRAWWDSGHLINTLTLLASLALTAWWAERSPQSRVRSRAGWPMWPAIVVVVLTAISGAIAALGDTLFPASSLVSGFRQDFDPAASIFLRLRMFHPFLAVTAAVWLAFYAIRAASRRRGARPYARALLTLVSLQIGAGIVNLTLLAPVWMQLVHLLLADLVWISLVLLAAYELFPEAGTRLSGAQPLRSVSEAVR